MIYVNDMPQAVKSNLLLYAYVPIRCKEINIKQQAQVTYLGCVLDESMSDELNELKVVNKLNWKLKFLYRK